MLLGVLGTNEMILLIVIVVLIAIIFFIYQFGKQRGRLKEMDRQAKERDKRNAE